MAGFQKPSGFQPPNSFNDSPSHQYLRIFKTLLMMLAKEGKTGDELVEFTKRPSISTVYTDDIDSQVTATTYKGIMKYTTLDQRKEIFMELVEAGEIE